MIKKYIFWKDILKTYSTNPKSLKIISIRFSDSKLHIPWLTALTENVSKDQSSHSDPTVAPQFSQYESSANRDRFF